MRIKSTLSMKTVLLIVFFTIFSQWRAMADEWTAKWIQAASCKNAVNTWQVFRKQIILNDVPSNMTARIAVDSKYWLWVNGNQVVFEGGLKRGPNPEATYYDEVDLAPYLHEGKNTIGILTCYFGKEGFSHKNSGRAALLFDSPILVSDETWQAMVHPSYTLTSTSQPNYRLAESNIRYMAWTDIGQWWSEDYDRTMPSAKVVDDNAENATTGALVLRPIPQWKNSGLKDYESVEFNKKTRVLTCRLPYDAQFTPYLSVRAVTGKTINIYTDHDIVTNEQCIRAQYVTRSGEQDYESLGWMNGQEVYYTIPEGVEVLGVKYRETGYDADFSGTFQCSEDFFNRLWQRSARTLYVNMRDTYFDCPDRERAQWWGDVVNELQQCRYVLSSSASQLTDKAIRELMGWQRADNVLFSPCPAGNWQGELPAQSLMSVGWYGFYQHYMLNGDSAFVADYYDGIHRYLHNVWKTDEKGFVVTRNGDWSWGDWGEHIDLNLLLNCWYYLALKAESRFAAMLGRTDDLTEINSQMSLMKSNFKTHYWNGSELRSPGYNDLTDDRANALAVVAGLADEDMYKGITGVLANNQFASPLLELYVQKALFKMGEGNLALNRARERYATMMADDTQTTLSEYFPTGGSTNHAWSGGMTIIMAEEVCGVKATSAGFSTFDVRPCLAGLSNASASFDTPAGRIEVSVTEDAIDIVVPEKAVAHVVFGSIDQILTAGHHHLENQTVGISGTEIGSADCPNPETDMKQDKIYDLSGRQRDKLGHGINIVGGKKIYIE